MILSNKYEILGEIGRGGMGEVYRVRHLTLHTILALKMLPASLAKHEDLVRRFHREARVMAQLHHPNIVRVLDVDRDGDVHYFLMDYVEGRNLTQFLAVRERCAVMEALDIATQIARALVCAHEYDPAVVHRDIKPSNVLIERHTGRVVVTDFGIAKIVGAGESLGTGGGEFLGTLQYAAPEQLTGAPDVDARADVYALGMLLYELVSGRPPYADFERTRMIAQLLSEGGEHPFRYENEVPLSLRLLIARATIKRREGRCASARELLADLEAIAAELPTVAGPMAVWPAGRDDRTWRAPAPLDHALPPSRAPDSHSTRQGLSRRAVVSTGLALATGAAAIALWQSAGGRRRPWYPRDETSLATSARSSDDHPPALGVMDFSSLMQDPQLDWMRDAIRDNLNSHLANAPNWKVFSKEFLDFKAQLLVREGRQADMKSATMAVAEQLGIAKAVMGSVRVRDEILHIEAHIVDIRSGALEGAEVVEGRQSEFPDLQSRLARGIMARLGISELAGTKTVASGASLESYRLLMQAEGGAPVVRAPSPSPPKRTGRVEALHHRTLRALAGAFGGTAYAQTPPGAAGDGEVLAALERYRMAYESKSVALLKGVYLDMTEEQLEANAQYFANARELTVTIDNVDVLVGGDEAAVTYTRRDRFTDEKTGEPIDLQVRLTKIFVRTPAGWKITLRAR